VDQCNFEVHACLWDVCADFVIPAPWTPQDLCSTVDALLERLKAGSNGPPSTRLKN
jgi:hypothetical protein